jgi:hypothetical protein
MLVNVTLIKAKSLPCNEYRARRLLRNTRRSRFPNGKPDSEQAQSTVEAANKRAIAHNKRNLAFNAMYRIARGYSQRQERTSNFYPFASQRVNATRVCDCLKRLVQDAPSSRGLMTSPGMDEPTRMPLLHHDLRRPPPLLAPTSEHGANMRSGTNHRYLVPSARSLFRLFHP